VAVGAISSDGRFGITTGHVRVFSLIQDVWQKIGLDLDGTEKDDEYGLSCSLSGDGMSIIAGGIGRSGSVDNIALGYAQVFTLDIPCPEAREEVVTDITLQLTNATELSKDETAVFERLTEQWYQAYFSKDVSISSFGVRNLITNITVKSQEVVQDSALPSILLTYDQNFTFVELRDAVNFLAAEDLILIPFQDAIELQLHRTTLSENIAALSDVQPPLGPPEAPTMNVKGPDAAAEPSTQTGNSGLSRGAVIGIAVASCVLGVTVAGLLFWRYRGKQTLQQSLSHLDLPVGELVEMNTPTVSGSADVTASSVSMVTAPVAVIAVDDGTSNGTHLPSFKEQSDDYGPSRQTGSGATSNNILEATATAEVPKDDETEHDLQYKDQVRSHRERRERRETEHDLQYKDQVRSHRERRDS